MFKISGILLLFGILIWVPISGTKESEEFIEYKGLKYERGMLECIPTNLSNHCCSCREYTLLEGETPCI